MRLDVRDRVPSVLLAASAVFGAVQVPSVLLIGMSPGTPPWARIVGLVFPVVGTAALVWYMRRYSAHRDPDTLFKCAGRGSVLGGLMLVAVGTSVVVIQQTIDRPIINPGVMISQLWLGGSLIGTTVGHLYAEARIETALFEQLLDNTEELLLMSDATAIAEQMVDSADRILGLDTVAVYEPVDETTLEPLAATEQTAEFFGGVPTIESRDAIAWSVLDSGDPTFADDVRDHPDVYNPDTPVRSEMIIPVSNIGVFIAASAKVSAFDETDRTLARVLVSNAEAVLGRAKNEAVLRERERKLERLQQRSQRFINTESTEETARSAIGAARDVIDAPYTGVHLLNEAGDTLENTAMSKAAREQFGDLPDYRHDNEQGSLAAMIWRVFERGESLYVPDTRERESLTEEPRSRCVLVYPVGDHGVFIASNERPDSFDNTDRRLFEVLASTLTSALDRVEREQRLRRQKSRMQQHRQRLTVLNRVLRHDIRNNVNLIFGAVSELRQVVNDAPALGAIENQSRKILELSENARHIEKTIEDGDKTTTTVDVTDVIIQNVESLKQAFSNPRIRTDMPEKIYVISNGLIDPAVENVLTNAIEHNDSTPPEVEVTVTPDNGDVVVRVADNGPGMPRHEREVFERKEETQLKHSNGIGLWLVHWIIEDVDGAVEVNDRQPRGTVVELRVPQPTTPEAQRQV